METWNITFYQLYKFGPTQTHKSIIVIMYMIIYVLHLNLKDSCQTLKKKNIDRM